MLGDDCLLATGAITPHKGLRPFHPTSQATSTSHCWTVVVHSLSCVQLLVTPWAAAGQASLSFTISQSLCKLMSIESMMPSNHLILCYPLSPSSPALNLSQYQVFSSESALCIQWPKYWSFNFSISLSNEYSGLISFRIDWFDLAVHGTFKSLL